MAQVGRRAVIGAGALALASTVAGRASAKTHVVTMDPAGSKFTPDTITIRRKDTVEWENTTSVLHSVTFDPSMSKVAGNVELPAGVAPFDSGAMRREAKFAHTFDAPGTYRYICKYHEGMKMVGAVIVK